MIPVTVIVAIRNEERALPRCLAALKNFQDVIVVDSRSQDRSVAVATELGANVIPFVWDKQYPKKRQWCLDTLPLKTDWVFFVDADEIVTPELVQEIEELFSNPPPCAGYFIRGDYVAEGRVLRYGLKNRKIALLDRTRMMFPVIDDLDIPGMGEMEGHYQPVLKADGHSIGTLKAGLLHEALDDERAWTFRHDKYARWEVGMNRKSAWPRDPVPYREVLKSILRKSSYRAELMFLLSYVVLGGFLDGKAGRVLAQRKYRYYKKIQQLDHELS